MNKTDVIIPRTKPIVHARSWQSQLSQAVDSVDALLKITKNDNARNRERLSDRIDFPIRVPQAYIDRIVPGNMDDPLLRQVLPLREELKQVPGYLTDPLEEASSNVKPGIIHKYHGRVLLVLTGACAVNCRYCFRRHFPYQANQINMAEWDRTLDYVRGDSSITEVIYSGGDPLANSDKKLSSLTERIAAMPHVQRLRIHSRLPIVIPDRVDEEMLSWLSNTRLQVSIVIHANHANELDHCVAQAIAKLRSRQITLLNQSVLLKGVNDNVSALTEVSEKLFSIGVLPYYLHQLDRVQGAAHYQVNTEEGQRLLGKLAARLPGYLVPRLVVEEPEKRSKTLLMPIS